MNRQSVNKFCGLIVLMALAALAWGCARDTKKPSEDFLVASEAYSHIEAVKSAYEAKKEHSLRQLVPTLSEQITKELGFDKAELFFDKKLIRISDNKVTVHLTWTGSWWLEQTRKLENRGIADFVLNRETMILSRIEGDNPFAIPAER